MADDQVEYLIDGVVVSKEEFFQRKAVKDKEDAAALARANAQWAAATGQDPTKVALAPTNPQVLDNGTPVVTQAARPTDAFTNRDRQGSGPNSRLLNGQGGPTVQPANGGFDARLATYGLTFNPQPNALNVYANYTYHIRWFLTSEYEAYNRIDSNNPNANTVTKTVIAESGVTAGFNIVDLQMKANTNANAEKRNMWTLQEFEMTISEPLGLSLFDKIYFSAQQIGVIDHLKCPYFIEVWFTGYDESGTIAGPQLFYNLYRVTITDCEAQTTQVGTVYHFKMLADNGFGEKNQYATPQTGLNVTCTTLGDFFDNLSAAMNEQQGKLNNDGIVRVSYKFQYPNIWKNWNIRPADTDKHLSRNQEMNVATASKSSNSTTIKINKGQGIENIVNFAVYLCKDAQDWITGANNSAPGGGTQADHALIGYVTVYASTKINGYDIVNKTYTREVTYTLFRTESLKAYVDMKSALEAQQATTQQAKLQYLVQNNRLVKRYDYYWTGLNSEVTTFDFKMNMTWAFLQPSWGQVNSYAQVTVAAVAAPNSPGYQAIDGTLPRDAPPVGASQAALLDRQLGGGAAGPVGSPAGASRQAIEQALANGQINPTRTITGNLAPPTTSTPASASDNIVKFDQSNGQLALTAAQQKNTNLQTLSNNRNTYLDSRAATLATAYVEDTKLNTGLFKVPPLPLTAIFDPKPSAQNAQQNADQTKTAVDRDPQAYADGTGFVGSIFNNVFSDAIKEFQQIELGIRGDPYWIATSNILQDNIAFQLTGNPAAAAAASTNQQQAVFLGGDNTFLLEMRVGVNIDEATGLAKADAQGADFFTGIYTTYEVISVFREGKFLQTLKAQKDVLSQNPISSQAVNGKTSAAPTATAAPSLASIANPANSQEIATQLAAAGI